MDIFNDPIILILLCAAAVCAFMLLKSKLPLELWLWVVTILLFALPRAGITLHQVRLPLPVAHVLVALMIVEWMVLRRNCHAAWSRIGYVFLIYTAVVGLGLMLGLGTGGNFLIAFLELSFYLFSIGLFFYTCETFCEQRHFLLFARAILIIAVLVGLYGIAQKYLGTQILLDHITYNTGGGVRSRGGLELGNIAYRRVLSSYGDPNVLAGQMVVFTSIALALVVGRGVAGTVRLGALVVLAVTTACTICTGSRAGVICLVVVGTGVLLWRSRWALSIIPILAVLGGITIPSLAESMLLNRTFNFQGIIEMSDLRAQFPALAWQLVQAAPLGAGLGNAVVLESTGMNIAFHVAPAQMIWAGLNSFWLNLFSRLGVPGILAFMLLIATLFQYVWRQARYVADPQVKAFLIGGLIGFVGQWLIWLVNNTYMLPGGGLNYWFMMGMLVAGVRAFSTQCQPIALVPLTDLTRLKPLCLPPFPAWGPIAWNRIHLANPDKK